MEEISRAGRVVNVRGTDGLRNAAWNDEHDAWWKDPWRGPVRCRRAEAIVGIWV